MISKLIILISGLSTQASKMFTFIFKFSRINSVRRVLFATIPPTLAAAFIIMSGENSSIVFFVSSRILPIYSDKILMESSWIPPINKTNTIKVVIPFGAPGYKK